MNTAEAIKAAQELMDVIDGYGEQLVPINRESATCRSLRKALSALSASAEQQHIGYIPKWAKDQLSGEMGGGSNWGVNTHIFRPPLDNKDYIAIYSAPQASQPVSALTDEQIIDRCKAAGINWIPPHDPDDNDDGFPGSFDMASMDEMRALLSATSQPSEAEIRRKALEDVLDKALEIVLQARESIGAGGYGEQAQHERGIVGPYLDHIEDELRAIAQQEQQAPAVREAELWNLRDAIMDALFRKAAPHVWESLVSEAAFQFITKRREYLTTAQAQTGEKTK